MKSPWNVVAGPDEWAVALDVDVDQIAEVRILSTDGEVRSVARVDQA